MSSPTISVIMLTYNRENLVSRAIESILVQTFHDFEFIIVDNGSSDRSGEIADEYAEKDSRIHVIHRQCGNIGSGRNEGLDAAKGEYISFVDDDDWVEPNFLEFLYKLAVENGADVSICGAQGREYDEKHVYSAEDALLELFWRKRFNVQFPTKLIHSRLFDGVRFSEASKYDDIELMPRILGGANKVAYHGLPKYTFYRHENNNSAWTTNHSLIDTDTLDEYLKVYRARTEWLCESFPSNVEAWKYFEWSFMISMVEKINRLKIKNCEEQLDDMINELSRERMKFMGCKFILDFEKEWVKMYI